MELFLITKFRLLLVGMSMFVMGCKPSVSSKPQELKYGNVQYSKRFGFAESGLNNYLFFVNNKDTQWLQIKEQKPDDVAPQIVVLSSVFAGFLNELNAQENIIGVDKINYYYDSVIHWRFANNQIIEVGDEGQINEPKLLASKPDYVISSGFNSLNPAFVKRLKQQNIQLIICDNFKEQHPLARAEWIKLFGVLLNKKQQADSLFNAVCVSYKNIQKRVSLQSNKSKVMTDAMFSGVWNVPGADSYSAQLINDAGGQYVFSNLKPYFSYPLSLEKVIVNAQEANVWIHVNVFNSLDEMKQADNRYTFFNAFKSKQVYNYNKRIKTNGGNDYWEKGVVRPDFILNDLANIFSNNNFSEDNLYFYTKLD